MALRERVVGTFANQRGESGVRAGVFAASRQARDGIPRRALAPGARGSSRRWTLRSKRPAPRCRRRRRDARALCAIGSSSPRSGSPASRDRSHSCLPPEHEFWRALD